MASIARPTKIYDFTAFARRQPTTPPPGDRLDAQLANHADAITAVQLAVEKLAAALEALPAAKPREATLPTPTLYVNAGGPYATTDAGATATSADYAQVSIEWAEHMPWTIPPNVLAVTAISGDHWSSRWWANKAANFYQALIGAATPPLPAVAGQPAISLYYLATQGQTSFLLSTPDRFALSYGLHPTSKVQVSRNGQRLMPDDGSGKGAYVVIQPSNEITLLWPAGQDETITIDVWEQPPPATIGPPGPPGPSYGGPLIPSCVGDGVANDGGAIQAALNASKDVYLPPGTYLVDGFQLTPQSGARISGPGTLLKKTWSGVNDILFLIDGKDDVIIDGVQARYPNAGFCDFVYARNSTRIKITRCMIGAPTELWYNGCAVFFAKNCVDVEASFNLVYGCQGGFATGGDPMFGSSTDNGTVRNVDIIYNTVYSCWDEMVDINWDTDNFRIIGNYGHDIGTRGGDASSENEAIDIGGSLNTLITDTGSTCKNGVVAHNFCRMKDNSANPAGPGNPNGVHIKQWSTNVMAHHNRFICSGPAGSASIRFSNAVDSIAHDNICENFKYGVYYVTGATRAHARNNKLLNVTLNGIVSYTGFVYTDCFTPGNEILGVGAATINGVELRGFAGGDISETWVRGGFASAAAGAGNGVYLVSDSSSIKAHNIRVEGCRVGVTVAAPFTHFFGGMIKNNVTYGLDAQAADLRVTGLRCQDNNTAAGALYNARFQATCARLHINGLIADDSRGVPTTRGVQFLGGDACYVNGVHVPRFLSTAVGGLNLLTNSVISDVGAAASQNATMASNAVTAQNGCKQLIVDTSGAASEALNTITYTGKAGDTMRVRSLSNARTPVVTDSANLNLAANAAFTLANTLQSIFLIWNGASWDEIARSAN